MFRMAKENDVSSGQESMSDDDSSLYLSDEDDSSLGSEMDMEAQGLWNALHDQAMAGQRPPAGVQRPSKSPEQVFQESLMAVHDSTTTSLKLDDNLTEFLTSDSPENDVSFRQTAFQNLIAAIQNSEAIKHVILGTKSLQAFSSEQEQEQLYEALIQKHSKTITYWKLGSDDDKDQSTLNIIIPGVQLFELLTSAQWPCLTEFQIRGMTLSSDILPMLNTFLIESAPKIKLFNLLGFVLDNSAVASAPSPATFDSLLETVAQLPQLDELQLNRNVDATNTLSLQTFPPLVSKTSLQALLDVKKKWWRFALDGMGLEDSHLQVLGQALQQDASCKMNDLLSLRNNPKLTEKALSQLYHICMNKQRMGLVLSDDASWEATFDLVRPLNNLHRRLEFKNSQGRFEDVAQWMQWFQVLSNLPWIDDARKLNYILFTLLEQPDMIPRAIASCSNGDYASMDQS